MKLLFHFKVQLHCVKSVESYKICIKFVITWECETLNIKKMIYPKSAMYQIIQEHVTNSIYSSSE